MADNPGTMADRIRLLRSGRRRPALLVRGDLTPGRSRVPESRSTAGSASGRSSAISPGPNRRAGRGMSQTAALAASKAGMPWASRPPIEARRARRPSRPSRARARRRRDRGAAVRLGHDRVGALEEHDGPEARAPRRAPGRARERESRVTVAEQARELAVVRRHHDGPGRGRDQRRKRRRPRPRSSSAHRHRARRPRGDRPPGRARCERRLDERRRRLADAEARARARRRSCACPTGCSASPSAIVEGPQHDGGQVRGIDRERVGGRGERDEPGPDPQGRPRRQARRPGRRQGRRTTTSAWPRLYLWPVGAGQGKRRRHSVGLFAKQPSGSIASSTRAAMPMSASDQPAARSRPGRGGGRA